MSVPDYMTTGLHQLEVCAYRLAMLDCLDLVLSAVDSKLFGAIFRKQTSFCTIFSK